MPRYSPQELARRAKELYEERIRAVVEKEHLGRYLVLDVDTGEYRIGDDHFLIAGAMQNEEHDRPLYGLRIGHSGVGRMGSVAGSRDETANGPIAGLPEGLASRGRELYERSIRGLVEKEAHGKYLALDVDSGDFEVGDDYVELWQILRRRRPNASLFTLRVGYLALGRMGPSLWRVRCASV
jgi:hypothetical protein